MIKKLLYSLILLVILGFTIFGKNGAIELKDYNQQLSALKDKLNSIRSDSANESNTVYGIHNNPGFLEKISREELGYSKQNEVIYVFEKDKEK